MATNRKLAYKAIRYLATSLPLMAIGPIVINNAFKNEDHPFYFIVLAIGILLCITAVFLAFKGLVTLTNSFFDDTK
ncbi:DUF6095 family protein [Flavobacterium sp.]|uniref:DUF6095 family protein n=1 Tax=Flavobacterium sp. TaxID=239 RepID=UPI003526E77F